MRMLLSQVWVAEQRGPGASVVTVHHPPAGKAESISVQSYVTCMDTCINGKVWMGHADGSVSMMSRDTCQQMCPPLDVFNCPVTYAPSRREMFVVTSSMLALTDLSSHACAARFGGLDMRQAYQE